jgi:hypothetical protein
MLAVALRMIGTMAQTFAAWKMCQQPQNVSMNRCSLMALPLIRIRSCKRCVSIDQLETKWLLVIVPYAYGDQMWRSVQACLEPSRAGVAMAHNRFGKRSSRAFAFGSRDMKS